MSLINEALKKAQRLRTAETTGMPPMPGGAVAARGRPRSAQSLLLLVAGGVALVMLSVVVTAVLLTRKPAQAPASVVATTKPAEASPVAGAPVVTVPLTPPNEPAAEKTQPARPVAAAPRAEPATTTPSVPIAPAPLATQASAVPAPIETTPGNSTGASATTTAPVALTAAPPKADERVNAFIDAIRVSGIRSSGGESRVLMNDRVYRVNDIVERTLGVRLTKVDPNSLTFTDSNGVIYVKYF